MVLVALHLKLTTLVQVVEISVVSQFNPSLPMQQYTKLLLSRVRAYVDPI